MTGAYDHSETHVLAGRYFPLKAFCPRTRGKQEFRLTEETSQQVIIHGPQHRYHELVGDNTTATAGSCVQEILLRPTVIYEGVRDYQEGGQCFCGKPSYRWTNKGVQCPPRPQFVFGVYVNPQGEIYTWRWIEEDKKKPGYPSDIAGFEVRDITRSCGWRRQKGGVSWVFEQHHPFTEDTPWDRVRQTGLSFQRLRARTC